MIDLRIHVEPLDGGDIPWRDKVAALRGQVTLLRMRYETGLPITIESLVNAERLARSLESEELPG